MILFTLYHVLVLHLAAFVKLLAEFSAIDSKLKKKKENFVWQIYFRDKWDNWLLHYASMWTLLFILPPLVDLAGEWIPILKEVKETDLLSMLGTAAIGYFGYDGVKWILTKFKK